MMVNCKKILFNVFNMNCVGYINYGLWMYLCDCFVYYIDFDYWVDFVRMLECGKFDGIFFVDIVGVYDVFGGGFDVVLCELVQVFVNDLFLFVLVMVQVMWYFGFGVIVNLIYELLYLFVCCMLMFDYLMKGCVGWNIVIGYFDSVVCGMGFVQQIGYDDCYECVDDYMDVVYKLWEQSWDDDVVICDVQVCVFVQLGKVWCVKYDGLFYLVDVIYLSELLLQCMLVLYQVGLFVCGVEFVGCYVECVFVNGQSKVVVCVVVFDICVVVVWQGCDLVLIRIFVGVSVVMVEIELFVCEKFDEYWCYVSLEVGFVYFVSLMGIDFLKYGFDELILYVKIDLIQLVVDVILKKSMIGMWIVCCMFEQMLFGGCYVLIVGLLLQVVDELQLWIDEIGIDGFNLMCIVMFELFEDFVDWVVFELQNCGVYKEDYDFVLMLCEKLFGVGLCLFVWYIGVQYWLVVVVEFVYFVYV